MAPNLSELLPTGPIVEVVVTDPGLFLDDVPMMRGSHGAAAYDLRSDESVLLKGGCTATVGTGIRIWVRDPGYAALILPRSGSGSKGLVLGNGTGLIDSDYQGPLKVCLYNRTGEDLIVERGNRVAQLVLVPVWHPNFTIVENFSNNTDRASNGFGSTGK